jgi:hypothetical protein
MPTPKLHDLEVSVCLNEDGDYVADTDADQALSLCQESMGGQAFRTVKLMVTMAAPEIAAVAVRVPDEAGQTLAVEA